MSVRLGWESRLRQAYRVVYGTPEGRMVLEDQLKFAGFARDGFVPGAPDQTAYEAGKRRVVLRILSFVDMDPRGAHALARETAVTEEVENG